MAGQTTAVVASLFVGSESATTAKADEATSLVSKLGDLKTVALDKVSSLGDDLSGKLSDFRSLLNGEGLNYAFAGADEGRSVLSMMGRTADDFPKNEIQMNFNKVMGESSEAEKVVITSAEDLIKNKELLQSPPNEANFWSGLGRGGDIQAANFTTENGGVTLEQLLEKNNIEMPAYNPLDSTSISTWEKASKLYAEQASGKVNAIIGENLRPDSIWKTYELPALEKNPNVTEITETNPITGEVNVVYKR